MPTRQLAHIQELKRQGRLADAQRLLEDAVALRPGDTLMAASLADVMIRMGRLERAEQIVSELLASAPDDRSGLTALGDLHLAKGRLRDALEAFRLACWSSSRSGEGRPSTYLLHRQAKVHVRLGELEDAAALVEQGLAIRPDDRWLRTERARIRVASGRVAEAIEEIEALAREFPRDRTIQRLLLDARSSDRPPAEVVAELDTLVVSPAGRDRADLWKLRAKRAAQSGDWMKAAASYVEAARLEPGEERFLLRQAGFAFRRGGDPGRAAQLLAPAFLDDPGDRYVRNCVFACLRESGPPEAIVDLIDSALARHPDLLFLHGLRRRATGPRTRTARAAAGRSRRSAGPARSAGAT